MAITEYTWSSGGASSASSIGLGNAGAITAGDLLLVFLRAQRTSTNLPTAPTISDNVAGGATWHSFTNGAFAAASGTAIPAMAGFYKVANAADVAACAVGAGNMAVSVSWTGAATGTAGAIAECPGFTGFTGTATLDPSLVQTANNASTGSGSNTSLVIPLGLSTTAAAAVSIVVAGATCNGTGSVTSPNFTNNGSADYSTPLSAGPTFTPGAIGYVLSSSAPTATDSVKFQYTGTGHILVGIAAVFYDKQLTGTAAGSFSFGGTATGTVIIPGTASGSFGLSGLALATDSGSGAGGFSFSGSATGTVLLPSTAHGAFSFSGSGTGTVKLPSHGSGGFSFGGSATAEPLTWTGVATGGFELTGRARGELIVPASTVTDTVTIYAYSFTADDGFTKLLNELPLKDISWSQNLNTPGSFGGTLNLADDKVKKMGGAANCVTDKTLIVVDVDGSIQWAGILIGNPYDSPTRLMKLTGREGWSYWESILQAFDYSIGPNGGAGEFWNGNPDFAYNIAAQVILDSLGKTGMVMALTAIDIDIETSATPAAQSQSFPLTSIAYVDDIVTQLSQGGYGTGFDFALDWAWSAGPGSVPLPIVTLSFPSRERLQAETGLVLDAGAPGVGYTYVRNGGTSHANRQYGTGGTTTTLVSDQQVDPSDGYGLFESTYSPQNVSTQDALDTATEGELAVTEFPPVTAVFTMPMFSEGGLSLTDIRMGDDMEVNIPPDERFPSGVFGLTLRLVAIAAKVPEEGVATMALTMTTPPGLAPVANPPE